MHWKISLFFVFLGSFPYAANAQDILNLAVVGQAAPDGDGVLGSVSIFALNEGAAAYSGLTTGNQGGTDRDFLMSTVTHRGAQKAFREGDGAAGDGAFLTSIGQIRVNSHGRVVFIGILKNTSAGTSNDEGIFSILDSSITQIVRENSPEPAGGPGVFNSFGTPTINTSGQVAFWGAIRNAGTPLINTHGIFAGSGGVVTQIARTYTPSPDGNGEFSSISSSAVISETGHVAFRADLRNTNAGYDDNSAICRGNGASLTIIARENDLSPDGNGRIDGLNFPFINDNGQTAFYTTLKNTSGGANDNVAIFRSNGAGLTKIARTGDPAPDGAGNYVALSNSISINTAGDVLFIATLNDGRQAVIRSNGDTSAIIARSGDHGPDDPDYTFTGFTLASINKTRAVTFQADLSYGDAQCGIFVSDGRDTLLIAKSRDQLNGSTISSLGFDPNTFNNQSELAFQAILKNGKWGVYLYSPKIKWRDPDNGGWDNANHWTASLTPSGYVQVDIDPEEGAVVNGPASDTQIRSLSLGKTSTGTSELNLQANGHLTVLEGTVIGGQGRLTGNGRIIGNVTNEGEVAPGNSPGVITVEGNYTQLAGGALEFELSGVATGSYDQLKVTGNAHFAGTLRVVLINGYTPLPGTSFTLVSTTGSISGNIIASELPEIAGITWSLTQGTSTITLTAVSSELVSFRSSFGLPSNGSEDRATSPGNSVPNLLYFLMGLGDPRTPHVTALRLDESGHPISTGLPMLKSHEAGDLSFSFVKRKNPTGYDYVVEVSDDLSSWKDVDDPAAAYEPTSIDVREVDATYDAWTLTFPRRTSPSFLRIRVIDAVNNN